MTRLESDKVTVNKTAKEVFEFLSDFNNYQRLMPEQVTDWKSSAEECSFTIKGMASLGMKMKEKTPYTKIVIEKNGKAPFDFFLICELEDMQSQCEAQLIFDADLNVMMKMMASKPLTNFLNLLASKLKEI
ncbi:MAG: SRPBCC family protein [Bacteroidota bacterium]